MKKFKFFTLLTIGFVLCALAFAACAPSPKVFEKSGIKITATSDFYEKDVMTQTIYLESRDKIITGLKEAPNEAFPISKTLREYTNLTLQVNNLPEAVITPYNEDGVTFEYFTYERTVSEKDFKYLGVTKKSSAYFYLFNFACETKNFDKFKDQFLDWAALIEAE